MRPMQTGIGNLFSTRKEPGMADHPGLETTQYSREIGSELPNQVQRHTGFHEAVLFIG